MFYFSSISACAVMMMHPPLSLLQHASLFLDFDGTLIEIAGRPDAVEVAPKLLRLLQRLQDRLKGRVAILTGRPVAQVRALLVSDVMIVGSHGLEFCGAAGRYPVVRPASLDAVLKDMRVLAKQHRGVLIEDKPLGVALHFRQCPDAEEACVSLATHLAAQHGLTLQPGKMMIEVRSGAGDKGTAIQALMREPLMAGTRPVFMGDDLTDEPGFVAAKEHGGAGILVGEMRASSASYRLGSVDAALRWLDEAAGAE